MNDGGRHRPSDGRVERQVAGESAELQPDPVGESLETDGVARDLDVRALGQDRPLVHLRCGGIRGRLTVMFQLQTDSGRSSASRCRRADEEREVQPRPSVTAPPVEVQPLGPRGRPFGIRGRNRVKSIHCAQHEARVGMRPGVIARRVLPRSDRQDLWVSDGFLEARDPAARGDPDRPAW